MARKKNKTPKLQMVKKPGAPKGAVKKPLGDGYFELQDGSTMVRGEPVKTTRLPLMQMHKPDGTIHLKVIPGAVGLRLRPQGDVQTAGGKYGLIQQGEILDENHTPTPPSARELGDEECDK